MQNRRPKAVLVTTALPQKTSAAEYAALAP
jgi:hypothetical protein